jgi:toxin ParE1/3/4
MIVRLTDEAERDIETIGDFIGCDNPQRTISFTAELRDKCLGLAHLPEGFPLVLPTKARVCADACMAAI